MRRRSRTDSEEYNDQSKYLYPNNEGTWFDLDYYCKVHMPMSIRMLSPALKGVSIESGLSGTTVGSKPTYIALCHLRFESVDAFLAAFSPHDAAPGRVRRLVVVDVVRAELVLRGDDPARAHPGHDTADARRPRCRRWR